MPIEPARDWSECLEFSRAVSAAIERTDPQRYTTKFTKARPLEEDSDRLRAIVRL
jgi:DNA primase